MAYSLPSLRLSKISGLARMNSAGTLTGLCKELLGYSVYPSDNSRACIVAPFYKKLENMRLQNTTLSGTFKCHKLLDPAEFRLTVIYHLISGKQSSSNITFKSCEKEAEFIEFKINENIPAKQAELHLVYNEKKIQTYYVQEVEPTGLSLKDIPIHDYVGIDDPQIERNADVIKNEVIDAIDSFNVLSKKHLGCKVFVNDAKTMAGLSESVKDKKDFTIKIASIASIINEVHTEDILSQVKSRPNKCGSINLIEHLQQKNVPYDKDAIKTLRKLYHLRSKMRPIHSGEYEIVTTLKDLGIDYLDSNWDQAARICVNHFLKSIQSLLKTLADIEYT